MQSNDLSLYLLPPGAMLVIEHKTPVDRLSFMASFLHALTRQERIEECRAALREYLSAE